MPDENTADAAPRYWQTAATELRRAARAADMAAAAQSSPRRSERLGTAERAENAGRDADAAISRAVAATAAAELQRAAENPGGDADDSRHRPLPDRSEALTARDAARQAWRLLRRPVQGLRELLALLARQCPRAVRGAAPTGRRGR